VSYRLYEIEVEVEVEIEVGCLNTKFILRTTSYMKLKLKSKWGALIQTVRYELPAIWSWNWIWSWNRRDGLNTNFILRTTSYMKLKLKSKLKLKLKSKRKSMALIHC